MHEVDHYGVRVPHVLNCINGGNTNNIQNGENCVNGGLATDAWLWANYNGGVTTEAQLPYLAGRSHIVLRWNVQPSADF